MTEEKIAFFTRKITSENRTGIICTMYEIFFEHLKDARVEGGVDIASIRKAALVLEHLKDCLDFKYEISGNLFSLYDFCQRLLAKAIYQNKEDALFRAEHIMGELQKSFIEVAKQDNSAPMMQNTQRVNAGMTYGRNDVNETLSDSNRGFLA